jgi:hypothetical protein
MTNDLHLVQAADRRHKRVHAGVPTSDGKVCSRCLSLTRDAARDLRVDALWKSIDDLWDQVRSSKQPN